SGDLLPENQLEGVEMGLGDLEAGFLEHTARRDQPAQRLADACHQGIAEARALALDVVHGCIEEVELFAAAFDSTLRGVEPGLRIVDIDARPFGVVGPQGGGGFLGTRQRFLQRVVADVAGGGRDAVCVFARVHFQASVPVTASSESSIASIAVWALAVVWASSAPAASPTAGPASGSGGAMPMQEAIAKNSCPLSIGLET